MKIKKGEDLVKILKLFLVITNILFIIPFVNRIMDHNWTAMFWMFGCLLWINLFIKSEIYHIREVPKVVEKISQGVKNQIISQLKEMGATEVEFGPQSESPEVRENWAKDKDGNIISPYGIF